MNTFLQIKDSIVDFLLSLKPTGAEQWLLGIGAALGLFISVAIGGFDEMIYALMALMAIDYITGTIAACKTGHWDSSTGFTGLLRKAVIMAVVALAHTLDVAMGTETARQMAICAYAVNEAGSIIENIDKCGWGEYIPAFIRNALARLKEKADGQTGSSKGTAKDD